MWDKTLNKLKDKTLNIWMQLADLCSLSFLWRYFMQQNPLVSSFGRFETSPLKRQPKSTLMMQNRYGTNCGGGFQLVTACVAILHRLATIQACQSHADSMMTTDSSLLDWKVCTFKMIADPNELFIKLTPTLQQVMRSIRQQRIQRWTVAR